MYHIIQYMSYQSYDLDVVASVFLMGQQGVIAHLAISRKYIFLYKTAQTLENFALLAYNSYKFYVSLKRRRFLLWLNQKNRVAHAKPVCAAATCASSLLAWSIKPHQSRLRRPSARLALPKQLASFSSIAKNFNKRKNQPNGFEPSSWAYSCTPNIVRI